MNLTTAVDAPTPFLVAKTLAAQGLAVFPVRAKQPLTPNGVYSATSDPAALLRLDWRNADGCGLATGETSGIDVLDVDVRERDGPPLEGQEFLSPPAPAVHRDGFALLAQLGTLPATLTAQTPRNGRHFYFRHVPGGRSRKFADGSVEWFSTGKLVVVPPAPGRTWVNEAEIAEAPEWLRAMVLNGAREGMEGGTPGPLVEAASANAAEVPKEIYQLILRMMRKAPPQQQRRARRIWNVVAAKREHRNDGLNWGAYRFRELVAEHAITAGSVCRLMWLAAVANGYVAKDGIAATRATIMSGLGIREWSKESSEG
jgi:hypothetical protein